MGRTIAADNVAQLFRPIAHGVSPEDVRIAEAMVFASAEPLEESTIAARLSEGADVAAVMEELRRLYEGRGVNLVRVARRWMFRTAGDLAWLMARNRDEKRKLSRAALETLAIVAYRQPVSRGQISSLRGVNVDGVTRLLEQRGYIAVVGHAEGPGQPALFGTTDLFLERLGLDSLAQLPPVEDFLPGPEVAGQFEEELQASLGVDVGTDDA
jgi:segregation and condensation protein B